MRVWSMVIGLMLLGCDSEKAPGASRYYERGQLAPHALISTPKEVDCQLSDGTDSRCMQFHFKSNTVEAGPYCPKNLSEVGGLAYYDGDTNPGLQAIARDLLFSMEQDGFDILTDEGEVRIGDPRKLRELDPAFAYCLDATANDDFEISYLVPLFPKLAEKPVMVRQAEFFAFALDGTPIDGPAPSIISPAPGGDFKGGNIPALDPCGGHLAPVGYFHWHFLPQATNKLLQQHAVREIECVNVMQQENGLIAIARDGYGLYALEHDGASPTLDACSGHTAPTPSFPSGRYHYHADNTRVPNIPQCLKGIAATDAISFNLSTEH